MLNDRQLQLLTARVDGELTDGQRRQVERLLEQSDEARALLAKLEQDAARLRALPCPVFSGDLTGPILQKIAAHRPPAVRPRVLSRPAAFPAWAGVAAAACVLAVIGTGTFFYLSHALTPDEDQTNVVARGGDRQKEPTPPEQKQPEEKEPDDTIPEPTPSPPRPPQPKQAPYGVDRQPENPPVQPDNPLPRVPQTPVFGSGSGDVAQLNIVTVHTPTVLKVRELDQAVVRGRMVEELRKDTAFRIELPCRNATKALERLQVAGKDHPLGFVVDPTATGRLKNPQWRTNFLVFLEDQTPEELTRLCQLLAAEDRKGASRKPPEVHLDRIVLARLNKSDRKELTDYLGADVFVPLPPRSVGPLGTDPRQPLPDLTANQVSQTLTGQGSPSSSKGVVRPPERSALVLTYGSARARSISPEVKRFIDARKATRPGTVQVMLVLRSLVN